MKYCEIFVKSALVRSKLEYTDFALNPYRGCEHQCVYCYSPYVMHLPLEEWKNKVYIKVNLPTVLNQEIRRKSGFISIGTVTDAYQPAEKKYEITRKSLEVLLKKNMPISILTKSNLILRDMDLIKKFQEAHIGVTITTLDEELRRKMEPNAAPIDARFSVLDNFKSKAITYAFIGPIIPQYTTDYLEDIIRKLAKLKVKYVIFDRFRWKKDMQLPRYLESKLDKIEISQMDIKVRAAYLSRKYGLRYSILW